MKTTVEVKKVTPELASEWLQDRWGEQRAIRQGHVERLASDMRADRFKVSPDAILRVKGKLANGQHRLEALVIAGKPQTFIVMESNDDELYKVIDSGLRRKPQDGLIGIKFASVMPSIAKWIQAYDMGRRERRFGTSQSELIDYCLANQEALQDAAEVVGPLYAQTRLLTYSIAGAVYMLAARKNKDRATAFVEHVFISGGANAAGDLRNRLISNKGSKAKLPPSYLFGISLKSYKSFSNGTRLGTLKWTDEENFPEL